jgi:hypothetical protein
MDTSLVHQLVDFAIIGAAMSVFVQVVKKYFGTSALGTQAIAVVTSLVLASVYYFFKDTSVWAGFLTILATATLVYEYVIAKFSA